MDEVEEASLLKNLTGGGGCGCGCLGLLGLLLAVTAFAGLPLELYDESQASSVTLWGAGGAVISIGVAVVGSIAFLVSLFLD